MWRSNYIDVATTLDEYVAVKTRATLLRDEVSGLPFCVLVIVLFFIIEVFIPFGFHAVEVEVEVSFFFLLALTKVAACLLTLQVDLLHARLEVCRKI